MDFEIQELLDYLDTKYVDNGKYLNVFTLKYVQGNTFHRHTVGKYRLAFNPKRFTSKKEIDDIIKQVTSIVPLTYKHEIFDIRDITDFIVSFFKGSKKLKYRLVSKTFYHMSTSQIKEYKAKKLAKLESNTVRKWLSACVYSKDIRDNLFIDKFLKIVPLSENDVHTVVYNAIRNTVYCDIYFFYLLFNLHHKHEKCNEKMCDMCQTVTDAVHDASKTEEKYQFFRQCVENFGGKCLILKHELEGVLRRLDGTSRYKNIASL